MTFIPGFAVRTQGLALAPNHGLLGAASLLAIVVGAANASAQQAPPSVPLSPSSTSSPTTAGGTTGPATGLQEVIVTARRREESLNTIPLSVTAISGASLDAQQIKDLRQLARVIPSLDYSDAAGGGSGRNDRSITTLTFRGLQLPTITEISPAGMEFIDGAPVIGASPPSEFDIKQVEALKGPQSVYFGRSTFAGAINFITRDPSSEFGGRVVAQVGDYGSNQFEGSLEGPIIPDVLTVRVGYRHDFEGGQYKNAADTSQRFGDRTTDSPSLTILYKPTSNLRVKSYITYSRDNDGPPAQAAIKPNLNASESNCNLGGTEGAYYCGTLPNNLPANLVSDNYNLTPYQQAQLVGNASKEYTFFNPSFLDHAGLRRDTLQSDVRADYSFGGGYTLTSITAYHTDKTQVLTDVDFRDAENLAGTVEFGAPTTAPYNYPWIYALFQTRTSDFSQELRLTSPSNQRFRWTLGGNYFTADYYFGNVYATTAFAYGAEYLGAATLTHPKTPAVFGAAYFDILPKLTLSLEGRYQWDMITNEGLEVNGIALQDPVKQSATFTSFSPRVSLDYKFQPNSVVYAQFARGYRPGGFNSDTVTQPANIQQQLLTAGVKPAYQQDRLDNYEIGFKSTYFQNRASLRVAAYYDPYTNGQVIQYFTVETATSPPTFSELGETTNAGKVILKGVEIEGDAVPIRGLSLNGSFAWNASTIKEFNCTECTNIYGNSNANGHRLAGAPEFTGVVSATYEREIVPAYDGFARMDYRYTGSIFVDNSNTVKSGALNTVDLHLGVRHGPVELEAFATNLFNEQRLTGTYASADAILLQQSFQIKNQIDVSLPDLRRLGLRATYSF